MVDVVLAASLTGLLVGLIALAMAVLAWQARQRSGNPQLAFVAGAFALFLAKSLFSAYNVWTHDVPHDEIELVLSLFDLLIIGALFLPFVLRGAARPQA